MDPPRTNHAPIRNPLGTNEYIYIFIHISNASMQLVVRVLSYFHILLKLTKER